MRKPIITAVLLFVFIAFQATAWADTDSLAPNHPEVYVVQPGDTLWGLANRFLRDPWLWPEIWHVNPQISNPHLIFPGDRIGLVYIAGQPRLTVLDRGPESRTVKLTPTARITPIENAIPAIPLDAVAPFMVDNRIVSRDEFETAPYVIAGVGERLIVGAGDAVYARGDWQGYEDNDQGYLLYRSGALYVDPDSEEFLGFEAQEIGRAVIKNIQGDISKLQIQKSRVQVNEGDRLLPTLDERVVSTFYPSSPPEDMTGKIIAVLGGVSQVGTFNVVVINRGAREGLDVGNVMAIYRQGVVVKDRITNEKVQLPAERAGLLMAFRVFEKVSYGLVLEAKDSLAVLDEVRHP